METTIDQIKMLNLTEDDFKIIIEGLDALPEKHVAGDMMKDMIITMMSKDKEEAIRKLEQHATERKSKDQEKQILKENVKIIQGKLLMLKRYLQEMDGLKQAYQVINLPK